MIFKLAQLNVILHETRTDKFGCLLTGEEWDNKASK